MPVNTYVQLDQVTLSSNGGPVTFTNIPQTYTDLRLIITGGFTNGGYLIGAQVGNGSVDTGTNYSYTVASGFGGGTVSAFRKSSMRFGAFCRQGSNTLNNVMIIDFLNYSSTSANKTWLYRYGSTSVGAEMGISIWRSNSAINTISIAECGDGGSGTFNTGNLLSGSTFSLYGIKAWATESTSKASGGFVYADSTYYYHAFLSSGTFTPSQSLTTDILAIAGGGGGGQDSGGGGGAGGLVYSSSQSMGSGIAYTITVGAGGVGSVSYSGAANGSNTSISGSGFSTITATGGGRGATSAGTGAGAGNGGSGGGGSGGGSTGAGTGTVGQGNNGGVGNSSPNYPGGGGGGAGAAGGTAGVLDGNDNGDGGVGSGSYSSWGIATATGENIGGTVYYAGGGGGTNSSSVNPGLGGYGGGGRGDIGGSGGANAAVYGKPNTGGGGGGGASGVIKVGGFGGSGLVIVRYAK